MRAKLAHVLAFLLKRVAGERLLTAYFARIQREFCRLLHRDDQEDGGEWIAAKGQQPVICQQDCRGVRVLLELFHDVCDRFL